MFIIFQLLLNYGLSVSFTLKRKCSIYEIHDQECKSKLIAEARKLVGPVSLLDLLDSMKGSPCILVCLKLQMYD